MKREKVEDQIFILPSSNVNKNNRHNIIQYNIETTRCKDAHVVKYLNPYINKQNHIKIT